MLIRRHLSVQPESDLRGEISGVFSLLLFSVVMAAERVQI